MFEPIPDLFAPTEGLGPVDQAKARHDVRTTALQLLGGTVVVVGAVVSALTLKTNRETLRTTQEGQSETLRMTQEGQITERFTRAIDQIGSGRLDILIGGIYALERIAKDSERDHGPVMEILTAYLRKHHPWTPTAGGGPPKKASKTSATEPKPLNPGSRDAATKPEADVRAVITVLRRRNLAHEQGDERLDLSAVDLRLVDLREARLERANLARANLDGAFLDGAFLDSANLTGARLAGARLPRAKMREAKLVGARAEGADLSGADLTGAELQDAVLTGGSNLVGAEGAQIEDAVTDSTTRL